MSIRLEWSPAKNDADTGKHRVRFRAVKSIFRSRSANEISMARRRLDRKSPMLAFRLECDLICSGRSFNAIDKAFNDDRVERIKLEELPGKGHSVLTLDFVDGKHHPTRKALASVLQCFATKLA